MFDITNQVLKEWAYQYNWSFNRVIDGKSVEVKRFDKDGEVKHYWLDIQPDEHWIKMLSRWAVELKKRNKELRESE